MTSITIPIPDDRLARLRELAIQLRVTAEDLVLLSVEELLARPDDSFREALDYVIQKNADLYRRLS